MPNLRIKDDAAVTRVIIEGGRAVGIEVLESVPSWRGVRTRVRKLRLAKSTAEIVLCCGVFRSPKLLMLSGIGPRKHLEEKGVPVVVDMPHVSDWRRNMLHWRGRKEGREGFDVLMFCCKSVRLPL